MLNAEVNKNPNYDINSGTILEWFLGRKNERGDTFVASTYFPPDIPEQTEGYVEFKRGSNGARTIVFFYPYSIFDKYYYKRTIFSGAWLSDWKKITVTYAD